MLQINWTEKSVCFAVTPSSPSWGQEHRITQEEKKKKDKATSIKSPTTIRHKHTLVLCGRLRLRCKFLPARQGDPLNLQVKEVAAVMAQAPENNQVSHGRRTWSVPVSFCLKLLTCRLGRPTGETSQSHGQQCQEHRKGHHPHKIHTEGAVQGLRPGQRYQLYALKEILPYPASTQIWNSQVAHVNVK